MTDKIEVTLQVANEVQAQEFRGADAFPELLDEAVDDLIDKYRRKGVRPEGTSGPKR